MRLELLQLGSGAVQYRCWIIYMQRMWPSLVLLHDVSSIPSRYKISCLLTRLSLVSSCSDHFAETIYWSDEDATLIVVAHEQFYTKTPREPDNDADTIELLSSSSHQPRYKSQSDHGCHTLTTRRNHLSFTTVHLQPIPSYTLKD
jgi:hypothetical protein